MSGPSDEERAVLERLAALDAEVRAVGDVERRRKAAIAEILRRKQAAAAAAAAPPAPPAPAAVKPAPVADVPDASEADEGLAFTRQLELASGALKLAGKADKVRQELTAPPTTDKAKSLLTAGLASTFLGPLGWFYAGSLREATVGSAVWLIGGTLGSRILPTFMLMPLLLPLLLLFPLSGIIGMMYASRYNRQGKRQRMFGPSQATQDAKKAGKLAAAAARKQLAPGAKPRRR